VVLGGVGLVVPVGGHDLSPVSSWRAPPPAERVTVSS
jgi:hypothetical protein